jgi:phosphatidylserine decarboxylase
MATAGAPIAVFNRYTGRFEHEPVYGERWLRWTYETTPGRFALWLFVKRAWFSRYYGWRMSRPSSACRIAPFIQRYGVDVSEFQDPPESFRSFNAFFVRKLQVDARPVCADMDAVVFPADGRHLGFADVAATDGFYAKDQHFDVAALLADGELARRFERGAIVISRLCPLDYHRFHFPCAGRVGTPRLVNGPLYSVNPIALRQSVSLLAENKRVVTLIEETPAGLVAMVEVGATCVGSIVSTTPPGPVRRGDEKGYFQFGGSCVITLFEPGRVRLADDLLLHSANATEVYARMGDQMGTVVAA